MVSQLCYATYIAAQLYPSFATLITTGFLVGIGAAPLVSTTNTFLLLKYGAILYLLNNLTLTVTVVSKEHLSYQGNYIRFNWSCSLTNLILVSNKGCQSLFSVGWWKIAGANYHAFLWVFLHDLYVITSSIYLTKLFNQINC